MKEYRMKRSEQTVVGENQRKPRAQWTAQV